MIFVPPSLSYKILVVDLPRSFSGFFFLSFIHSFFLSIYFSFFLPIRPPPQMHARMHTPIHAHSFANLSLSLLSCLWLIVLRWKKITLHFGYYFTWNLRMELILWSGNWWCISQAMRSRACFGILTDATIKMDADAPTTSRSVSLF
jgi:hypothetical protein